MHSPNWFELLIVRHIRPKTGGIDLLKLEALSDSDVIKWKPTLAKGMCCLVDSEIFPENDKISYVIRWIQ